VAEVKSPQVTVVIPTFDRAALLPRAVESVLAQKGAEWELVIVDDGSTDDTPRVLERWSDARIRKLRVEHGGVSAARNAGAALGSAPYIAFLDSDDEWLPGKLAAQLEQLGETELQVSQTEEIWIRRGVRVNPPAQALKSDGDLFAASLERCMITPSSVIMTRSLFEKSGGFRTDFAACEDYELWLRLTSRLPIGLIRRPLLKRYGGHDDQLSAKYPAMDHFRIRAIALLLEENDQAPERRAAALETLSRKLRIFGAGCAKRGRAEELAWCEGIRARYLPAAAPIQ
jgi:glycosyltransferase involved in cell wall biosynthesis